MTRVVLASRSPRRSSLLTALGVEFEVVTPRIHEMSEGEPIHVVEQNAIAKVRAVAKEAPEALVIGGDTEVALEGMVLGQPESAAEAGQFIRALSGREHEVVGAVAVLYGDEIRSAAQRSLVRFREVPEEFVETYVASGEWQGCAGGYAIQGLGSALVEGVEGDLSNVIGLPVGLLLQLAPELK
jgi:nucleoside triphosphate pyrophosphatase